ncbi:hypothetical protein LZ660_06480 [Enterobacter hormaechei]|uniref:hypothetical protein n=1 Tax=Enterobacter hormaechei TaxID=158836 RepID=UPI001F201C12|nr:hypothetical protein [Enterobacter hormaechei]MCE9996478.1 hypothetical protein [Enterobacter hormaechei]MCF0010357.1 hypothetical protein [Enterobacter hormaechei]
MEIKNARATERHIELEQTQARSVIPDSHDTHQTAAKPAPKKHKARVLILRSGTAGITENEILRYCRLSSGRNYLTELERCLDIQFERIDEPNPDGIGSHYRYRFIKRSDVQKVIALVNTIAVSKGHQPLNQMDVEGILKLYPDNATE